MVHPPGLALFDLDNTLVDRRSAFSAWASNFVGSLGGGPDDVAWLVEADDDGHRPRAELFDIARSRWALAEPVEALVVSYRRTQVDYYRPDPTVLRPLCRLRQAGWRIGVVTNGAPVQHHKIERAGLASLLDAVSVSSEVGKAKPDPAIFLDAARCAPGVGPDRTVIVGDSPEADIAGASALDFTTVWLDRGRPWPELPFHPDHMVSSVGAAVDVILDLGRGS